MVDKLTKIAVTVLTMHSSLQRQYATMSRLLKNGVWTVLRKECKEKEKIRLEKDGYRIAVENVNEGTVVVQNGIIRFINPALTRMTGYTAEEVLGRPFTDFLPEEDARELIEKHLRRMKGNFNRSYRFRVFGKNGCVRWFEINAIPVEWEGGHATLNFLRDVTDEMIFEQKLRESEEKFRAICEFCPFYHQPNLVSQHVI